MAKLKPGDKIGPFPYQIVKQLGKGQGNMSDVYLATEGDRPNTPLVVLKISRADSAHGDFFTDTIYNEAERLRQLSHPGIVHLLPIKTNNASMRNVPYVANASLPGRPWFLVLEHLSGGALDDILNKEKRLPQVLALRIAQRLAATLDYIHRCGQVHLDIKPENILFRRELTPDTLPDPVLIDFGIARNVGQEGLEARTLHYSPPERVLIHKSGVALELLAKPAPSMDVYSLGVVLYQMLTGRRPYEGHNDKRISSAILNSNPTKPSVYVSDLDRDVENIVLQAMAKDPAARPTAGEMAQRLEAIAVRKAYSYTRPDGVPARSAPARQKRKGSKTEPGKGRRKTGLLVAGGVAIAGLALIAALLLGGMPATTGTAGGGNGGSGGAWWEEWWNGLPWPTAPNSSREMGVGPVIDWQTATPTTADTLVAVAPTSTPVPLHSTATYTQVPTSTAVRKTNTPTPTLTATRKPTPTAKPVATSGPATSTPVVNIIPAADTQETPTATATAVPVTPTATRSATPTRAAPTSTPVVRGPGQSATKPPTATLKISPAGAGGGARQSTPVPDRPTNTPTPRPATPVPTTAAVAATTAPAATSAATADFSKATVRLLEPVDGYTAHGVVTFRWETAYRLQENEAFEPVFWRGNADPLHEGRGYGGSTRGTSVTINWDVLDIAPDGYQWGVLLVKTNPYDRILYMGGGRGFQLAGPDDGDSGSRDSAGIATK